MRYVPFIIFAIWFWALGAPLDFSSFWDFSKMSESAVQSPIGHLFSSRPFLLRVFLSFQARSPNRATNNLLEWKTTGRAFSTERWKLHGYQMYGKSIFRIEIQFPNADVALRCRVYSGPLCLSWLLQNNKLQQYSQPLVYLIHSKPPPWKTISKDPFYLKILYFSRIICNVVVMEIKVTWNETTL